MEDKLDFFSSFFFNIILLFLFNKNKNKKMVKLILFSILFSLIACQTQMGKLKNYWKIKIWRRIKKIVFFIFFLNLTIFSFYKIYIHKSLKKMYKGICNLKGTSNGKKESNSFFFFFFEINHILTFHSLFFPFFFYFRCWYHRNRQILLVKWQHKYHCWSKYHWYNTK